MQVTVDLINLKPPRAGRWSMPMVLAVLAHLLLIAALTWGVNWKQDAQPMAFEAELWSAVAQKAAPREVIPPPPPPPRVEPKVEPKKVLPEPEPKPKAEPTPPDTREADIATAQAKKKKEEAEAEKREAEKKAAAKEKAAREKAEKEKQKARAEEIAKQKALDDKIKQLAEDKKRKAQEAAAAKAREDQMRRIMGQAGATGDANATGSAQRSSGPSAGYAGRVRARIKPNVLLTEDIAGNPKAEVEVTTAPDGNIVSRRLVKSSGVSEWDRAALAAIDRTGSLPRDTDGRVPSPMTIVLSPRE
jgi:colicin import membrane protein